MSTDLAPRQLTPRHPVLAWLGYGVLVLDVLGLAGCLVLATASWNDTSSSTASIGVAVAVVLAVPLLVSAGAVALGLRLREAVTSWTLVVVGAVLTLGLGSLVALQLLLGS